jgi:hypothetical protein
MPAHSKPIKLYPVPFEMAMDSIGKGGRLKRVNGFRSLKAAKKCTFCKQPYPNTEQYFEKSKDNWGTLLGGCRNCLRNIRWERTHKRNLEALRGRPIQNPQEKEKRK